LKALREAGLVEGERVGAWVWYRVVPERLEALRGALAPAAPEVATAS
jgi:ArsR family transcriptional regulator